MSYENRRQIIAELEGKRKSKIITLILSDRNTTFQILGINAAVAPDQVDQVIKQIKEFEKKNIPLDRIELLIYSRGGDTNTAWILVNTIRNYAKEFNIIIPIHSHSAATLIGLGANNIIMTKTASLSPIDPTVANEFNPKENNVSKGISVEDVTSFMALAKDQDRVGIKSQQSITEVFKLLATQVHPLALGNVKRSHTQIRILAKKLLELHIKNGDKRIEAIIDSLTEKFYTHYHLIFRDEARKIGLTNIVNATAEEENLLWNLYKDYEDEMRLKEVFDINMFLNDKTESVLETTTVMVESTELSISLKIKQLIRKTLVPDVNHRLQVLGATNQYVINAGNLKNQLAQIVAALGNINMQIAGNPPLQPIFDTNQQIVNTLSQMVGQVPNSMDISELLINIETKILEIGWI
jgi:hypothetical protein